MKHTLNKYYPVKAWATSIVLANIIGLVWGCINAPLEIGLETLLYLVYFIFMGALLSLPALILHLLIFKRITELVSSELVLKSLLTVISVSCFVVIIYLIDKELLQPSNNEGVRITASYSVSILIAGLFHKVYQQPKPLPITIGFPETAAKQ